MGAQVVHLLKVEGAGGNLGKHIDGERRPETAVERELSVPYAWNTSPPPDPDREPWRPPRISPEVPVPPVVLLDEDGKSISLKAAKARTAAALAYIEDCRIRKFEVTRQVEVKGPNGTKVKMRRTFVEGVRGRKADPCVALLFAGPPRYGDDDAWSQKKIGAWAEGCIKWALKKGGKGCRIAHCALHQDEAAPHLHLVLVAADEKGRLGWNRIRQGFGITGKERGPELMSAMQSSFHLEVGKQHGLERGEIGSTATHQPIDRQKGLELRIAEELKPLQRKVDGEPERADKAEERADKVEEQAADERQRADEVARVADERKRELVNKAEEQAADERQRADEAARVADERKRADEAADERVKAAQELAKEREDERVRYERLFLDTRDENEDLHEEVLTLKDKLDQAQKDLDQAQKDLVEEANARDQQRDNFKVMAGVVRELRPSRWDLDSAAKRAGIDDGDDLQWLRNEVERGRGGMDR